MFRSSYIQSACANSNNSKFYKFCTSSNNYWNINAINIKTRLYLYPTLLLLCTIYIKITIKPSTGIVHKISW